MARFDWDRNTRQARVASHGAERSEYTDITEQTAKAKGFSKIHGPYLKQCSGCGKYIAEDAYEAHRSNSEECRTPRKISLKSKNQESDNKAILEHFKQKAQRNKPRRLFDPVPGQKDQKVRCTTCKRLIHRKGIIQHYQVMHWQRY